MLLIRFTIVQNQRVHRLPNVSISIYNQLISINLMTEIHNVIEMTRS